MKKTVSVMLCVALFVGMIATLATGWRTIGSNLIGYVLNVPQYEGLDKVDKLFENVEQSWNTTLFLKEAGVDIFGLTQKLQNKQVVYDPDASKTVYKGSDGNLYFAGNVLGTSDTSSTATADRLAELAAFCAERSAEFLFVCAPSKYNAAQVTLPVEYTDDSQAIAAYAARLDELGVNNLNLMAMWEQESDRYADGFFATDHHWNIQTAFWGFQKTVEKLNTLFDTPIADTYWASESYTVDILPDCFLGSMGARTGSLYIGKDDLAVIAPHFETDFYVWCSSSGGHSTTFVEREGSFDTAILNGTLGYSMYISSDERYIHVDNRLNNDGKKVLLIKDSFAVPVAAWLSCCCDELTVLDLRYEQEKPVCDYIEELDIDTVIVLYNAGMLESSSLFDFGLGE